MRREALFTVLLMALLAVSLTACGGNGAGTVDTAALQDGRGASGATIGDFEVIRCNADGQFDPAMNPTLKLRLDNSGGEQALTIGVKDTQLVNNVELEVRFDDSQIHADRIELAGIYGASQTVSLALPDLHGKAAIGEYCVNDVPVALNGDFATVYFATGSSRTVSANQGPYNNPLGVDDPVYPEAENVDCLMADSTPAETTASLTWFGAWQRADGNQDSLITVADITPIGVFFGQNVDSNWAAARADYNRNRFVEVADLTPIGQNYDTGTSQYRIEASDDTDAAAVTLVKEVDWGGEEASPYSPKEEDAHSPDLYPVWTEWDMTFDATSAFTWGNLQALDTNGNSMVRLHVTPHDEHGDGTSAFRDIEVTAPIPPADVLAITSYNIRIAGASGGVDGELFDEDNGDASVIANTDVTLTLESVSGSFNAVDFDGADPGNWPEGMEQADYDSAFDAAQSHLTWTFEHHGAPGFRRTTDWLVLDSAATSPVTGDPGLGTIFPDEDPESDETAPEASLLTNLPSDTDLVPPDSYPETADLEVHVYGAIGFVVNVDVLPHEKQAQLTRYGDDPENPLTELLLNENTFVPIQFMWGSEIPSDFTLTGLELHRINPDTLVSVGPVVTFDFITELDTLQPGDYQIRQMGEDYEVFCIVPGANLVAEGTYAFRIYGAGMWSSINYPEDMLTTKPPPPPQDLEIIPQHGWPAIDWLQVFYTDPVVRRNPKMHFDFESGSLQPDDELAFNDVLKSSGDEFFLQTVGVLWPRVAVQQTDDPDNITSLDDEANIEGPSAFAEGPGRILIDVIYISPDGQPSDPTLSYALKLFNADGSAVGQGVFDMAPIGNFNTKPTGKNWGVNAFDREDLELNGRHFDNFVTDGTMVGSARPDVLWFEFGGGWVFDTAQDEKGTYANYPLDANNVMIHVKNAGSNDTEYMEMALRVVGLDAAGYFLAIHTVTNLDWRWPGTPGWPGQLKTGDHFILSIDDPHYPGLDYTFPQQLIVTGDNPNI